MNTPILSIVFLLLGVALGYVIGYFITKSKLNSLTLNDKEENNLLKAELDGLKKQVEADNNRKNESEEKLIKEIKELRNEKESVTVQLTKKESDVLHLLEKNKEQKEEVSQLQEKFTKEFENLANKILEEKSNKFAELNKENLKLILNPLQQKIVDFEQKVDTTHKESISHHATLKQQIIGLTELNDKMTQETLNLTKALKGDSKMQGNWGELVLERVLEKSGLEKDREYSVQQSFTKEDGSKVLPDVIIHLPDNKKMVVDSKVSLTAYERYVNEEDENEQKRHLNEHLLSIKKHVDQLSAKNYQDLYEIESPDFVLLFIPIEPAFALAINTDKDLYLNAFGKNIVIVTPTTLLATLRTIDSMWTNQKQQDNALEIARQAGALYDKFEGFIVDLLKVGKRLGEAKLDYDAAMNKLSTGKGNLVKRVENLKTMGAKASKSLNEPLLKRALKDNEELN